jgi:transcriptional regulator with XRE-family HTH domain
MEWTLPDLVAQRAFRLTRLDPKGIVVVPTSVGTRSTVTEVRSPDIRTLRARLGLSQELFSRVLDVSARSIERWEARATTAVADDVSRRLAATSEILSLAAEVYGDDVASFMSTPRRSLRMRTPRDAMIHGDLEAVRHILVNALEGHWA